MPSRERVAAEAREGFVNLDGANLAYRLSGHASALPPVVFENGWSASY